MTALPSPEIAPFRKQALEAVCVMFNRAVEQHGPDEPLIEDRKTLLRPPLPANGALQDCEFGIILLLGREWLGDELSAAIEPSLQEKVVKALVKSAINRVLDPLEIDQGGGGKGKELFTGEPYSEHSKKYAANLDAAMITVSFLMLAVAQYNGPLAKLGVEDSIRLKLPDWAENLRDAALFVITEGLRYALDCRVVNKDQFQGFSCDPESRQERPEDGYVSREDRLFYTLTACETINDLINWREEIGRAHV